MWRGMTSVVLGAGMPLFGLSDLGPAHAVYFSTYEVVKQRLGGNVGYGHHPLATCISIFEFSNSSRCRSMCSRHKRSIHESI